MLTKKLIPKIEKALGYKLRDWQIAYIFEEAIVIHYEMFVRRSGKTTAYILKHALEGAGKVISDKQLEYISDEMDNISYNKRVFKNYYMSILEKLNYEGIPTIQVIKPIW